MIKLRGTWKQIDPIETHWQCEYGHDEWDLSCETCNESPDRSSSGHGGLNRQRMNRAHWRNPADNNYLCDFHYSILTCRPPAVKLELPSADEFASSFDTN